MPTIDDKENSIVKLKIKIEDLSSPSLDRVKVNNAIKNGIKPHQELTASIHLLKGNPVYAIITSPSTGKICVLPPKYFKLI